MSDEFKEKVVLYSRLDGQGDPKENQRTLCFPLYAKRCPVTRVGIEHDIINALYKEDHFVLIYHQINSIGGRLEVKHLGYEWERLLRGVILGKSGWQAFWKQVFQEEKNGKKRDVTRNVLAAIYVEAIEKIDGVMILNYVIDGAQVLNETIRSKEGGSILDILHDLSKQPSKSAPKSK